MSVSPLRTERSTLSEHDWQAGVLAELGVPRSGLVTPDEGRVSPPPAGSPAASSSTPTAPAPAPAVGPPPAQADPWSAEPPVPTQWNPPEDDRPSPERTQYDGPSPEQVQYEGSSPKGTQYDEPSPEGGQYDGPSPERTQYDEPSADGRTVPPAATVHSAPVPPGLPQSAPDASAAAWELASQSSWGLVAQVPWGAESPEEPEPPHRRPEPWEAEPPPQRQGSGETEPPPQGQQPWEAEVPPQRQRPGQTEPPSQRQEPWEAEVPPQGQGSGGTAPPPQRREPWEAEVPPQRQGPGEAEAWQRDPAPAPPRRPVSHGPSPQDLVRRSAHGDPLVRRVSRGVRRAVGGAADEVRLTADVENLLGRSVASCRQIAVTSIRGGAGKTTVAGLTATVIAQYRQDRVLAIDADSGLGSLPLRLGVRTERSLHDLAASRTRTFEDAARFLGRTADGLWVLSGTSGGRITGELDLATFKTAAGAMSRYFAAFVVDCGAGLLPELQRGILTDAHAQVMVTPGTVDGALSARGALEWQARNGYRHLLARTVIAFVTHTPHVDADLTRGAQLLSGGGMPVVHMPYDRHLATGTAVESARIGRETRAAAIRVALEAFARATSV